MADDIATLGLDNSAFNSAVEASVEKMKSLGGEALVVTRSLAGMALVAGGALVLALKDAKARANELEATISKLESTDPFNTMLVSLGELQGRLKTIDEAIDKINNKGVLDTIKGFVSSSHLLGGSGYDAVETEELEKRNRLEKERFDTQQDIGAKMQANNDVLQLQLDGEDEMAKLLKVELEYKEKIGAATKAGNAPLAVALKDEQRLTEELIKQETIKKRQEEEAKAARVEAAAEAKAEIDKENAANDRAWERREEAIKSAAKQEAEASKEKAKSHDKELDYIFKEIDALDKINEAEEKRLAGLEKIVAENEKITNQLASQSEQMRLQSEGRGGDAELLGVQNDYAERIKEQNRRGNPEGAEELKRQQAIEEQRIMADIARETPGERRDARRAGDAEARDARNQEARDDENEKRFDKGQRSRDINESIERRANRARENIDVQQDKQADGQAGYSAKDSENLQAIADAFKERD